MSLFRIWNIPYEETLDNQGLNGFFDPVDEKKWGQQGKEILCTMLNSSDMLLCAEDLGVIPKVCKDTIEELGIPGNDVQRWTKDWKKKHDFLPAYEYRRLSVAMLSTHDTTNWAAWWENEAGTVDEALFIRKCQHRGLDYRRIKEKLFNPALSTRGRLRWLIEIDSEEKLVSVLGKPLEQLADFIEMYKNSFLEKEKLWKLLGLEGKMGDKCGPDIISAIERFTLSSESIFCIELIIDLLSPAGVFTKDPYEYRINFPGTISDKNWSLRLPVSLEKMLKLDVNRKI